MTGKRKSKSGTIPVEVKTKAGESEAETMARVLTGSYLRHGVVAHGLAEKMFGELPGNPGIQDYGQCIKGKAEHVKQGDLTLASELLIAQALSLDAMFTELARRATMNFGDYPLAAERYARLAFKAQSNSRSALEAVAKLHQPREQTVRHVHVNEGGQAIVADQFHHHAGGIENAKVDKQPHATGATSPSKSLPGADPCGNGVPIASDQGQEAVPNARREGERSACGQ
ncbi:hypothetical protein [Sphingopyxis sp. P8]|uniref:hypothetical protein n=1 Tax=Sphingopyxis sp. P8 TaxID=2763256 RepID=UPI001D0B85E1|nr:hypothetical protein [Sphingopyxis sp. P8]